MSDGTKKVDDECHMDIKDGLINVLEMFIYVKIATLQIEIYGRSTVAIRQNYG